MLRAPKGFGGGEGLALQVADDGVLEGGDEVEGLLVAEVRRRFGLGVMVGSAARAARRASMLARRW